MLRKQINTTKPPVDAYYQRFTYLPFKERESFSKFASALKMLCDSIGAVGVTVEYKSKQPYIKPIIDTTMKDKLLQKIKQLVLNAKLFANKSSWDEDWQKAYDQSKEAIDDIAVLQIPGISTKLFEHMVNDLYVELYAIKTYPQSSEQYRQCLERFIIHVRVLEGLVERNFTTYNDQG